eukprot:353774-Chlamydomonas_euryale.AAC.2
MLQEPMEWSASCAVLRLCAPFARSCPDVLPCQRARVYAGRPCRGPVTVHWHDGRLPAPTAAGRAAS